MPSSLTRAEADRLVDAAKIVMAKLAWKCDPAGGWRIKAKAVVADGHEVLEVLGQVGRTNYSFVLLYDKYPLRRFTKHARHAVGKVVYTEPHKHVFTGRHEEDVYTPNDIDPTTSINEQFLAFCGECHVEILGDYQHSTFLR